MTRIACVGPSTPMDAQADGFGGKDFSAVRQLLRGQRGELN